MRCRFRLTRSPMEFASSTFSSRLFTSVYFNFLEQRDSHIHTWFRLPTIHQKVPFNTDDVEQDRQNLLTFFRQEGYFQVEVAPEVKVDAATQLANVVCHVGLERRAVCPSTSRTLRLKRCRKAAENLQGLALELTARSDSAPKLIKRSTLTKATKYLQNQLEKQDRLGAQMKAGWRGVPWGHQSGRYSFRCRQDH